MSFQFRLHGLKPGEDIGQLTAQVDTESDSETFSAVQFPAVTTALPKISDGFDGATLSIDTTGFTGPFTFDWRIVGGASQGSASTLDTTGLNLGGQMVECALGHLGGTTVSPAVMVYASGMASMAAMNLDDMAIIALVPHAGMTHIAVADGDWSDAATWSNGRVPGFGAKYLIPHGTDVTYDETRANIRMAHGRVDGTLTVTTAANTNTKMFLETIVTTRSGTINIGTGPSDRMPADSSFELTFSGKDYSQQTYTATDLNSTNFVDTLGWGRGFICQGENHIWAEHRTAWGKAAAGVPQGATSLDMKTPPVNWRVGNTILISGTNIDYTPLPFPQAQSATRFDEERVITAINGTTITWDDPLLYRHDNQLVGSTRNLTPAVSIVSDGNIVFASEVTDVSHRRGHNAWVHHHCTADVWGLTVRDCGRNDKDQLGGVIDVSKAAGSRFKKADPDAANGYTVFEQEGVTNNLIGRYGIHAHHLGFNHSGARPIFSDCLVVGIIGWGYVHHACDVDFRNCVGYKIHGAGMVGEAGNELGAWDHCLMIGTDAVVDDSLERNPKDYERMQEQGDFGRGYGFAMRGRGVRLVRSCAASCSIGVVFFHRYIFIPDNNNNIDLVVTPAIRPQRANLDLQDAGRWMTLSDFGRWRVEDYPIVHVADIEIIACIRSTFVTKWASKQFHDVNVVWKNVVAWGWSKTGISVEYIQNYLFRNCLSVAGPGADGDCYEIGGSTYQVGLIDCVAEGGRNGVRFAGSADPSNGHDFFTQQSPRYYISGFEASGFSNLRVEGTAPAGAAKSFADVFVDELDLDGTFVDYAAVPTLSGDEDFGTTSDSVFTPVIKTKSDQLSSTAAMTPKPTDEPFPHNAGNDGKITNYGDTYGIYEYPSGSGTKVIAGPHFFSDRLTGMPGKKTAHYTYTGSDPVDSGVLDYSATPISANHKFVTVPTNGSVTVDVVTGATGGGSIALDYGNTHSDHLKTDHGVLTFDVGAGTVEFTPDPDFAGGDEATVFLVRQGQYATVRIYFLVGDSSAVTAPAVTTNFVAADGGSQEIDVTVGDQPVCGDRFIRTLQYSLVPTGTTPVFTRLTHRWDKGFTKTLSARTDGGGALAGGTTYDFQLRYLYNFDGLNGTPSPASTIEQIALAA